MDELDVALRRYQPTGVLELGVGGAFVAIGAALAAAVFESFALGLAALFVLLVMLALLATRISARLRQHQPPPIIVLRTHSARWKYSVILLVFLVGMFMLRTLRRGQDAWLIPFVCIASGFLLVGFGEWKKQHRYAVVGLVALTIGAVLPLTGWTIVIQMAVTFLVVGCALVVAGWFGWHGYMKRDTRKLD